MLDKKNPVEVTARMVISMKYLEKMIPFFQWLKQYDVGRAVGDLVAGITVGLTLIPQSIAYASLAGLEPQYGLYSSLCGGLIYMVFGTIPELNIAPTALLSLLTYTYTKHLSFDNVHAAILLCFIAGIVELLCGILHLGFLVNFVSTPVVAAFTSAGAITIATSQIKNLLGLKFDAESFFDIWRNVFEHITEFKKWDTTLGLTCCVILLLMRKLKDFGAPLISTKGKERPPTYRKIFWLLSVSRNALVVIACATAAFILDKQSNKPFSLTAKVPPGFPNISLPSFTLTQNNKNITLVDMIAELHTGIIFVPLVAILANVGIAKAFAHGKVVDASQEMIAVGLCNIIGSFFGSYPVNASFSRAAVGGASGVRTPLAGIYTAGMVCLAFTLLMPYFAYIPKPTLAAVIICAVIFMVEIITMKNIWNICRSDLAPFLITLVSCLIIGIELGILIGILVDLIKVLYLASRPKVLVERIPVDSEVQYLKFTPTSSILFSSAEYIRERVLQEAIEKGANIKTLVIDCQRIYTLDYTAALCFRDLVKDLKSNNKEVIFLRITESITNTLNDLFEKDSNIFSTEKELNHHLIERPVDNKSCSITVTKKLVHDDTQL